MTTGPIPVGDRSPLRVELVDKLVTDPHKTRRIELGKGQDMTGGLLCPECVTEADLTAAITRKGQPTRLVPVEYFRSKHWSVWVGRCVPCDLILYAMRFDEHVRSA